MYLGTRIFAPLEFSKSSCDKHTFCSNHVMVHVCIGITDCLSEDEEVDQDLQLFALAGICNCCLGDYISHSLTYLHFYYGFNSIFIGRQEKQVVPSEE